MLKGFAIPFHSGLRFVRALRHDPSVLGALHRGAHGFTKLHKAGAHVISLVSFL